MAKVFRTPSVIKAEGKKEKIIREFFGLVNSGTSETSIAVMKSPEGWEEPGQTPEFNEYTLVLSGKLKVETANEEFTVSGGEAILARKGEWVRYSSPFEGGAEYVAVCIPAFSPATVHRDSK
jgi:mannose-6-phosphate isomerase-like protein (cupin superfamily)